MENGGNPLPPSSCPCKHGVVNAAGRRPVALPGFSEGWWGEAACRAEF